jgi:metal-sulfur cluster biosynthetic enzyme
MFYMKKTLRVLIKSINFFILFSLFYSQTKLIAQCANNNTNLGVDMTPAGVNQTVSLDCITGGQYVTLNVVTGSTYTITTCATTGNLDTEITLFNGAGASSIAYNDDACGRQSTITYTAAFTGTVRILVDIKPCSDGTTCANLDVTLVSLGGSGGLCNPTALTCGGAHLNSQSTIGLGNDFNGPWGCANNPSLLTGGTDRVYTFNFAPAFGQATIYFNASSATDQYAEIILANACTGTCINYIQYDLLNSEFAATGNDNYTFSIPSAGTYYLIVDSQNNGVSNFSIGVDACENTGTSASPSCVAADNDADGLVTTWNGSAEPNFYCPSAATTVTVCHKIYLRNPGWEWLKYVEIIPGACFVNVRTPIVQSPNGNNQTIYASCGFAGAADWTSTIAGGNPNFSFSHPSACGSAAWGDGNGLGNNYTCRPYTFCYTADVDTRCNTTNGFQDIIIAQDDAIGGSGGTATSTLTFQSNTAFNPPTINPSVLNTTCGLNNGSAGASVTGGTSPYTYLWSNGITSTDIVGILSPGNYTLTVTDNLGCRDIESYTVASSVPFSFNAGFDAQLTCLNTTATIGAASANTTYLWSNSATTATISVSSPNTYTVTATNALTGCTASDVVVVSQDISVPLANAGADQQLTCTNATRSLSASGGGTYLWSNGATTASISVNSPNNYTVTVTNTTNGCTASDVVVVSQDISVPLANAGADQQLTCTNATRSLSASGGGTYLWSNGATTASISVNSPNNYTVTVTNTTNGCTASDVVVVSQDISVPLANAGADQQLTCTNATRSLSASGGGTYLWSNGATTASISVNSPNNYTVTVTNTSSGCTASDVVVVSQDIAVPLANAGADQQLTCTNATRSLSASGGGTYLWSNGATTASISVNSPNNYTVTVTNTTNGCTASDVVVVSQDISVPLANAGADQQLTCTNATRSLSASGGGTYLWSNGATTASISVNSPNNYTVTVTNTTNGCTASDVVVVSQDIAVPLANAGADQQLTCTNATRSLSASGGGTYLWSNGATTASISVNSPNNYTVTVTNTTNGCTASDVVVVSQDISVPLANAGADQQLTCTNATRSLSASGGGTYLWSNGATTASISVNSPNNYTVTVTNTTNGCTASDVVVVSQDIAVPLANAGADQQLTCTNATRSLSASGGGTYLWSNGATTASISVNSPNNYTVTVTNTTNGCTASDVVVVSQDISVPLANAGADQQLTCTNATRSLSASGGGTYLWSNGATTASISVNSPNNYTVTVTNTTNGCTASDVVVVSQDIAVPLANAGADQQLTCTNATRSLSASGGGTYLWSNGATTASISVNSPNNYTVTVTNTTNGCTASDVVVVSQDISVPLANAGADQQLTCTNATRSLSASGGGTYLWSNGATTASISVNSPNNYTVTVTNTTNGCTASDVVVVSQDISVPLANAGADQQLTCTNATRSLSASGGGTYLWSNGATTASISVNSPNNYTVTVTNTTNGCTASDVVVVSQDIAVPLANAGADQQLTCTNATRSLSASGGGTYLWSNGATTASISVNSPNNYTVTVTNTTNGCTASDVVVVSQDISVPLANAGADQQLTCTNATRSLSASGGGTYLWSNGATTASISVNSPNNYTVTVTNTTNGCTASDVVVVSQDISVPLANAGADQQLTCTNATRSLSASGGGTYLWSNGATTASISVNSPNNYTVTVTNTTNGCTASDVVVVSQDISVPLANAGADQQLTCTNATRSLSASGGGTYLWSNGATTASISVNSPNNYTVTVTNTTNGCTASDVVVVSQDIAVPLANAGADQQLTCTNATRSLSASGGGTYLWSNGATTASISVNSPNNYTVTVTNTTNGCTASDVVVVSQDISVPLANAGADQQLTCTNATRSLSASGGGTYLWSNGATTASISVNSPNNYTVTVTNTTNGCTASDVVVVSQDIAVPLANAGADQQLTCTNATRSLSASGGGTYLWSNGATTASISVNSPNNYTVTVTNTTNGCTASDVVVVSQDISVPLANAGADQQLTCTNATRSLSASGGGTYLWSNGATTASISVNSPNNYTVTVTNTTNGCTASDVVVVSQDISVPLANAGADQILTCATNSLTIGSSAVSGHSYLWSNGATTSSQTIASSGIYILTVTNTTNGCTGVDQVQINQDANVPSANAGTDITLTCTTTSGTIGVSSVSGNSYLWSNGITTSSQTASSVGTYSLTVTNTSSGCTASDVVVVSQDISVPLANAGADQQLTCTNATRSLSASGGGTYLWSNGATTASISVNSPNNYTVTVTNTTNGCTASDVVVVSQDISVPLADAGSDQILTCTTNSLTIGSSAVSGSSYLWSNGATTSSQTIASSGIYILTVTNTTNGCTGVDQVQINQDANVPSANAGTDITLTCTTTSGTIGISSVSGNSYLWSNGITTSSQTVSSVGTYSLTVTNTSSGCTASDVVVVSQDIAVPLVDAGSDQILTCTTNSLTIGSSAVSGSSYLWSNGATTSSQTIASSGIYILTVTNTTNGCTGVDQVQINQDANVPSANAGIDITLTCTTTSGTIGVSSVSGNSYLWSNGITTSSQTVSSVGTYSLTVTNTSSGCTASDVVVVSQDIAVPLADAGSDQILTCTTNSLTIGSSAVSGSSYLWSNGATTSSQTIASSGIYILTVTNTTNGCTGVDQVQINQDANVPSANAGTDITLTCTTTSGTIGVSSVSGNSYLWSNGITTSSQTVSSVGTYSLTVTNTSSGCTASDVVVVSQDIAVPLADAGSDQILTCTTNSLTIGSSAVSGNSYLWSNGATTSSQTIASSGIYILTVTNTTNGCTGVDQVQINQDANVPSANAGIDITLTCTTTSGTIGVSSVSGNSYLWSNGITTSSQTVSSVGTYSLTVTNTSSGCTASDVVVVSQDIVSTIGRCRIR